MLLLEYLITINCISSYLIPDFGVSMGILNLMDIFRGWCKLNLGIVQGQVKSRHFSEWIGVNRQHFHVLYKFLGLIV